MIDLTQGLFAGAASFVGLAIVFVPLERVFPARAGQRVIRPGLLLDAAFFFGQYVVWNLVAFLVLSFVESLARAHVQILHALAATLPSWMLAVAAVILGDVCVYWFHRACHAWGPLWRFHSVHHSSEHLDWVAAHREHPVDGILTALAANLPAFAMGLRLDVIAGLIAFRSAWAIFVHSNTRIPLGPLRWLLGAPELHHWHHARDPKTTHNFANLAPWIDALFGTHHCPQGEESYALGTREPMPRSYLGLLVHPFGTPLQRRSWANDSPRAPVSRELEGRSPSKLG